METNSWIEYYYEYHLTKSDLLNLKKGDVLDVVIFNRNYEEYFIWNNLKKYKKYIPTYFYKGNRFTLTYIGNLSWNMIHNYFKNKINVLNISHNIEIDVSNLNLGWTWMHVINNKIIINTKIENGKLINLKNKIEINFDSLPDNTRIGWRGPMILWNNIKNTQKVFQI